MKVRLIQSGGFLGIVRSCEVDTAALGADAAAELERLVRGSGISSSGEHLSESGRDLHVYEITVEDGDSSWTVVFDDASVPPAVRPVFAYLRERARPVPPG